MIASLKKLNARKPIIEGGRAIPTQQFFGGEMLYGITIWDDSTKDHTILMDKDTMLNVVIEWLKTYKEIIK